MLNVPATIPANQIFITLTKKVFNKTAETFKSLQGPVYVKGGDQHNFNVITETTDTQKELVGPVYLCEKNQFNVVTPRAEAPKEITGPVYLTEEARHKYAEFVRKVEGRGGGWA